LNLPSRETAVSAQATPSPVILFGLLSANPKGFAFVRLEDGGPDVFIPPRARLGAQHGERVGITLDAGDAVSDRRSGAVVQIPDRAPEWIGEVIQTPTGIQIKPVDARLHAVELIDAPVEALGSIVHARLLTRPRGPNTGQAQWLATLGTGPTANVVNAIVSRAHDLPAEFAQDVLEAADAFGDVSFTPEAYPDRVDLRKQAFVTIDGASSRDLDDALWAQTLPNGRSRLLVAIADVSHYVRPGSIIDAEAQKRTTSTYLPGTVNPMLPNALSQGLCSLNPDVERLCVVCEMDIDELGNVASSKFYRAVMLSHARMTYNEVEEHLFQSDAMPPHLAAVEGSLRALRTVYERLAHARSIRGAMDFQSNEVALSLNASGAVRAIYKPERTQAHRLVEETMVAANVQAARTLHERDHESLFRIHGAPPLKKHGTLNAMLQARGLPELSEHGSVGAGELSALALAHPQLSGAVMRAQDKARYETRNIGHFGLGLDHYAHFTSPIRRYPDLVMHRVLVGEAQPDLEMLALACSEGERRSTAAEREATDRLRAAYLADKQGERMTGKIDGMTRMGAFISLDKTAASGLLPLSCFGDNAVIDEVSQHITDSQGVVWSLGQELEVALASSDWRTNRIEFAAPSLVPHLASAPRP
jgi:ribonuclease R